MKHKKLLIGIIVFIAILSIITVATTYNSKQEALAGISSLKAKAITIDKSKLTASITSRDICKLDYETEEETGCKACAEAYYNISEPIKINECYSYANSSFTEKEIDDIVKIGIERDIERHIKNREQHNIKFVHMDRVGKNLTFQ